MRADSGADALLAAPAALTAEGDAASVTVSRPSLDDVYLRNCCCSFNEADEEVEEAMTDVHPHTLFMTQRHFRNLLRQRHGS